MRKLIKLFNLPPPPTPPAKNYAEKSLLSKVGLKLSATWTLLFTSLSLHPWPLFLTPRGVHRIREVWLFTNNPWGQYEFSCVGIQSPLSLLMENPYSTSLRYNIVVASVVLILERERERELTVLNNWIPALLIVYFRLGVVVRMSSCSLKMSL